MIYEEVEMRISSVACAAVLCALFFLDGFSTAEAGNCKGMQQSSCEAARKAATDGPYTGRRTPTTKPMVCVYALYSGPTELVLVNGPEPTGNALLRWRPSSVNWRTWARDPNFVVGEICIPEHILHGRSAVTLCNGKRRGEGNHSTWRTHHIRQLLSQRRISADDPACLLGGLCARYGL